MISKPGLKISANCKIMSPVISLLIGAMIFIEPTFAEDITQQYTLPAQPLNKALSTVASLAKLKILFDAEQIHTLNTQSLMGTMTTAQVLEKLLQGSGYNYRFLDTHTVKLEKIPVPKSDQVTLTTLTVVAEPTESTTDHYTASNASTATKTNTPLMETPLSITVMHKAVIQDQQAVQLSDVTKNVSGVFQGTNLGGFVEQFIMRGFNTSYVNYYDGYRFPNASGMSLANAERVEVIKGTAANLYGHRTTADATGAVTENGSLLYRLNLEYLTKNSFRDYGYNERTFLAPSITWKISDRDQVDVDLMYSEQNSQVDYGLPLNTLTNRPANVPISRYLGEPATDNSHSNLYNTSATYTHAFSEDWKLSAKFTYLNRNVDFSQTSPLPFLPFPPFPPSLNTQTGVMQRAYTRGINTIDSYFGTVDMTGRFTTGVAKHTLLAGWDNYQLTLTEQNYLYPANSINIYNPIYRPKNISQLQPNDFHDGNLQWNGAYIQDQITLFTKLHILGGGRYDWISETAGISDKSLALASARSTSVQNGRFNPRVGLLYQPWQWLSLYGNYVESLGAANINTTPNGTILQPETAEQLEAGFKTVFFEERLSSTVAFYSLT
ncbi:MAG: TonB-dependent receptor, partial [Methylobacter sp.]|nr:TonB-dependent receptor [Methylobacter sp.]